MDHRQQQAYMPALAGLRFFAALAIFCLHFLPDCPDVLGAWRAQYDAIREAGVSGVPMFFALSGFILAYSYATFKRDRTSLIQFYINRIARIYPVYLLAMLWFAPFALYHRYTTESIALATSKVMAGTLSSALLIQSWFHPKLAISWNGPSWSLSVEAVFYLVFPFLLPVVRRCGVRGLMLVALLSLCASVAMVLSIPVGLSAWQYLPDLMSFNPLLHLPAFVFGTALGCYVIKAPQASALSYWLPALGVTGYILAAIWSPKAPPHMLHNTLMLPFFGMIFVGLAKGGLGSQFLAKPSMVLLGEASYSFYILQFSLAMTFWWMVDGFPTKNYWAQIGAFKNQGFGVFFGLLLFSILASVVVFKLGETPWRVKVKAYLQRRFLSAPSDAEAVTSQGSDSAGTQVQAGRQAA